PVVGAPVPDRHAPGAVAALGDVACEVEVLQGVVFRSHGEVVLAGVGGDALGYGPRRQGAVALEPEVPVEARGVVLLHHETAARGRLSVGGGGSGGLRGAFEVAQLAIAPEPVAGHARLPALRLAADDLVAQRPPGDPARRLAGAS